MVAGAPNAMPTPVRFSNRPAAVTAPGAGEMKGVQVVAVPAGVRPALPERRDRDHHQVGVDLAQRGKVQTPLAHLPRPVVLDEYVGLSEKLQHLFATIDRPDVQ